jgi:hypothetical protein
VRKRSAEVLRNICASYPKRAVVDALMDVKGFSKPELQRLYEELQSSALLRQPQSRPRPAKSDGSPAARIKRILTVEAGLSAQDGAAQLRSELLKIVRRPIPEAAGSLDRWLSVVLDAIPAGEVLNAAMTVAQRKKR